MKIGQLLGFILEGLPEDAQQALATLQADAPPMAPGLAASVVRRELGQEPERLFLHWTAEPAAAASVGQVHRAVLRDGRSRGGQGAVPGRRHGHRGRPRQRRGAVRPVLRVRPEGSRRPRRSSTSCASGWATSSTTGSRPRNQSEFAGSYRGHPFITVPAVVDELSTQRVLTTEWVDGLAWADFLAHRGPRPTPTRRRGALPLRPGVDPPARRLQRRPPPRQLPLPRRRPRHLPRLRPGQALDARRVGAAVALPRRHPRRRPRPPRGGDGGGRLPPARPRPRPPGGLRLRQHALPAVPDRAVQVHPRVRGATRCSASPTSRARTPR